MMALSDGIASRQPMTVASPFAIGSASSRSRCRTSPGTTPLLSTSTPMFVTSLPVPSHSPAVASGT